MNSSCRIERSERRAREPSRRCVACCTLVAGLGGGFREGEQRTSRATSLEVSVPSSACPMAS